MAKELSLKNLSVRQNSYQTMTVWTVSQPLARKAGVSATSDMPIIPKNGKVSKK